MSPGACICTGNSGYDSYAALLNDNLAPCILPRLYYTIFCQSPLHPSCLVSSQCLHKDISYPSILIRYGPRSSKVKHQEEWAATSSTKGSRWSARSPHCVFELTVCREAASRHQKTSRSQKRTPTRNTISQAILIQEQSRSRNPNTALLTT